MTLKLFGAILIVVSCGSIGFLMTAAHRKEVNSLEQLVSILDYFMCILQHHMLPLAEICRSVDSKFTGLRNWIARLHRVRKYVWK